MKKRIISFILLIFMLIAMFPVSVSAAYWGDIEFSVYVTSPENGGIVSEVKFWYIDGVSVKNGYEGTPSYTYQWLNDKNEVVAEDQSLEGLSKEQLIGKQFKLRVSVYSCRAQTDLGSSFDINLIQVRKQFLVSFLYTDHKGEDIHSELRPGYSSSTKTIEMSYTFDPVCYAVDKVDIGIDAPVIGEKPSFNPSLPETVEMLDIGVEWWNYDDSVSLSGASRFKDGYTYLCVVNLKDNENDFYYFPSEFSAFTFNGIPVEVTRYDNSRKFLIECKFPTLFTPVNTFADVKESNYFYDPVMWALYHEPQVTKGTDDKHFSPGATCDRGQVVTFLWRASGEPEPKSSVNPFTDVKTTDYFYKAVLWAVEKGITNGVSKTQFGPKQPCDRGQVVTFLWRAKGEPEPDGGKNPFDDVKESDYFYKAVLWAVGKDVTKGTDATKFSPKNSCTRGQVVTFLYRADKIPVTIKYPKVTVEADRTVIREDAGDKAVLTAKAEDGRPPYSYQWKKWDNGWCDIPGATGESYTATAAGKYDCWVEDSVGTTGMSNSVTIYGFEVPESNGVNELGDGFLFYIENAVEIKGRGIVATGTVLNGSVKTNESLTLMTWDSATATAAELPLTVAGIEKNHAAQETAGKGDAAGLLFQGVGIEDLRPGSALVGAGSALIASEGPFYGTLSLRSEADGGTHEPVYVDNMFDLEYAGHAVMGELQGLGGADEMNPGDTREDVCFGGFDHPVVWYVGQVLTVKEGDNVLGTFTITRVS